MAEWQGGRVILELDSMHLFSENVLTLPDGTTGVGLPHGEMIIMTKDEADALPRQRDTAYGAGLRTMAAEAIHQSSFDMRD